MANTADPHIFEAVEHLFQPDTLISYEALETVRKKSILEPEKRLLMAVLEDGIRCFQKYMFTRETTGKKLFCEAKEWIFQIDDDSLFSFESLCEILGFDPGYFRKQLMLWERTRRAEAVMARRMAARNANPGFPLRSPEETRGPAEQRT